MFIKINHQPKNIQSKIKMTDLKNTLALSLQLPSHQPPNQEIKSKVDQREFKKI